MDRGTEGGVQVRILGTIGVTVDGQEVDLGPRRAHVLAVLAVNAGSVVSVDRLVDIAWPATDRARAVARLRTTVTRLRRALGGGRDRIAYRDPGYVLHLGDGELDRDVFLAELEGARRASAAGELDRAGQLLERALSRWDGEALAGHADEDWARPECVRLTERRTEAQELQVEVLVATGRAEQAVAAAGALVEAEPLRERPRELLMTALHHAGRPADALQEFRSFRELLSSETGLDPSEAMVELQRRILRRDLTARPRVALRGYELGERIGTGAHASVHRATQPGIGREVAVKIIRETVADDPDFVRRFDVEARTVARIEHPYVVPLYDYWREPGAAYLVMRLMRGGSVGQALRTHGPFGVDRTVGLLRHVGDALTAAHRVGVIHRDVRPANLLLDTDGVTYLADFGIARPAAAPDTLDRRATGREPGRRLLPVVEHPAYSAPEVLRGGAVTAAADVLSLGVTVFELLTGRPPFADSNDRVELVRRQLHEPLPPVRATRPDLPADIDAVLARATAKAPAARHPTVAELVTDLIGVLDPTTSAPVSAPRGTGPDTSSPYVGLRAFDEAEADLFFGREDLVAELLAEVGTHRMVTVVGPSGSGKSSVVRAGLLPALRAGGAPGSDRWFVTTMLPGADPVGAFESALRQVAVSPTDALRTELADDGGLLRSVRRVLPEDAVLLLVIDQFEEVFTQTTDDPLRKRFLDELAAALTSHDTPLRVVATVRADHFDEPLRHPELAELVDEAVVTVRPLAPRELERVIVGPAARRAVRVEPALVAELVAAVADRPAALPLLQYSLTELFERRDGDVMRHSTHHELGGLAGAVAARADRILDTGQPGDEEIARRVFGRLVTLGTGAEDTRRRSPLSELGDDEDTARLLEAFVAARLLVTDRDPTTREPTVEIAHETLLRAWPRLMAWIDDDRADLATLHQVTAAASAWDEAGRDPADLARGGRLELAAALAERRPGWLTSTEAAWIDDSRGAKVAAVARERRQTRRLRRTLATASGLLVLAVAAAAAALVSRGQATANQATAERAAGDAEAARADAQLERVVALSGDLVDTRRDLAILLALEAVRRRPGAATHTALHRAIAADERLVSIHPPAQGGSPAVALGVSGRHGVAWSQDPTDGRFQFVALPAGTPAGPPIEAPGGIQAAAVAGDGSVAAVATDTPAISLHTPDGASTVIATEFTSGDGREPWLTISDDGQRVAWNELQETAHVHDRSRGRIVLSVEGDEDLPYLGPVALSPDGRRIALARSTERIHGPGSPPNAARSRLEVHDVDTGEVVGRSDLLDLNPLSIAIADDGTVAAGSREGVPTLWNGETGSAPVLLGYHEGLVERVAASANGIVVSVSDDATAQLWSTDGRPVGAPIGLQGEVDQVAFVDDGTLLLAHLDGTLYEVDIRGSALVTGATAVEEPWRFTTPGMPWVETFPAGLTGYRLRSLESGAIVHEVDLADDFPDGVTPFAWWGARSHGGEWTLRTGMDGSVAGVVNADGSIRRMFDVAPVRQLGGRNVEGIAFQRPSNDGERLFVVAATDGSSRVAWFDTRTGGIVAGPATVRPIGIESNGPVLLEDGTVVLGDRSGALLVLPPDLAGPPVEVPGGGGFNALAADEATRRVLVGGADGQVGMLDVDSGTLEIHATFDDFPLFGSISPDGGRALVHFTSSGTQLVDLVEQAPLGVTILDGLYTSPPTWTDDGASFWTPDADQGIRQYSADPARWVEIACGIVHRDLSVDEWHRYVDPDSDPVSACR